MKAEAWLARFCLAQDKEDDRCKEDGEWLIGDFARIKDKHADLFAPAAIEDYFEEVFWRVGTGLDREDILKKFRVDATGTNFAYRSAGDAFRMIESGHLPVIVPGDEAACKAIADLDNPAIPSGKLARQLQGYIVQVPPKARALLMANRHVMIAAEETRSDQFATLMTPGLYSAEMGLVWEDAAYIALENSMI